MGEMATLVNRSSKDLEGMWDGKVYVLKAHKKYEFDIVKARKFREQNPVMGSLKTDTLLGDMQYLLGVVEDNDPITPIEQTDFPALDDIKKKLESGELKLVQGNGLYRPAHDRSPSLRPVGEGVGFSEKA